jgi:hypothetical protein
MGDQNTTKFAEVNVTVEVSLKVIEDLFCCAVEGGSEYWCKKIRPLNKEQGDKYEYAHEYMAAHGFYAWDYDEDKDTLNKIRVSPKKIKEAIKLMAKNYPRHFKNAVFDDGVRMDASTGDVFLQLCCLGDVIYG